MTPNASLQLLPKAGAQRTLEAVSCKALFGAGRWREADSPTSRGLESLALCAS